MNTAWDVMQHLGESPGAGDQNYVGPRDEQDQKGTEASMLWLDKELDPQTVLQLNWVLITI